MNELRVRNVGLIIPWGCGGVKRCLETIVDGLAPSRLLQLLNWKGFDMHGCVTYSKKFGGIAFVRIAEGS